MMATPVRTCVGCRSRRGQTDLRRFVRQGDRWQADGSRRGAGRGCYLCGAQCARAVVKNKRYPGLGTYAIALYEHQDTHMND
jgi:predicted RNA-binding protein YlxR (DUF448 family)